MDRKEQLEWEASRRRRAGIASMAGGALWLIGGVINAIVRSDEPQTDLPGSPLLRADFFHDHARDLLLASITQALGAFLFAEAILFLATATRFRRPEMPGAARIFAVFGPVVMGIALVAQQVIVNVQASDYASNPNYETAKDVFRGGALVGTSILLLAAIAAVFFAFMLTSLNAMRVGLLTRFMGVLGIIVGVLFVIPLLSSVPVVTAFWLFALGWLVLGRWPGGDPPAWASGKAEPWPSAAEMREAAQEGREPRARGTASAGGTEEEARPAGKPRSSSKKKSRKRRR